MKKLIFELQTFSGGNSQNYAWCLVYLWINTDKKNEISKTKNEICEILNSKSLSSSLKFIELINKAQDKIERRFVEVTEIEENRKKSFHFKFNDTGVATDKKSNPYSGIVKECTQIIFDFYRTNELIFDEKKEKALFVKSIPLLLSKIDSVIISMNLEPTNENRIENLQVLLNNMPTWWVQNKNIFIGTINKHFAKIINQIKLQGNDKFKQLADKSEQIDFSEFTSSDSNSSWSDSF